MKNKYTLLVIPPDHKPTRQYQFSMRGKKTFIAGSIILGGIITGLFIHDIYQTQYIKTYQSQFAQVDYLKTELANKNNEISDLHTKNAEITANIKNIDSLEQKIASILKLDEPLTTSQVQSRGITPSPQSYIPSENAQQNADYVASHLELFQQYYDETIKYEDKVNHTPSILPVIGEIASPFGYRRNPFGGWSSEFHNGVDLACDYGTPVHATAEGIIIFAGWDGVYGRKVEINHGNGIITFYGHNSKLLVKSGEHVKKGDIIAYSGNSGRSTGAHLHYGALVNGKSVDPLMFTNPTKEQ